MAIAHRATGTAVFGIANLTPGIPAAQVTGDLMICFYGTKPFDDAPTIDNGWTDLGASTDGTVAAGNDLGSMQARIFYKIATSDTEADPTITNTTNNVSGAIIMVFSKGAGENWVTPVAAGGGDNSAGTAFSVTASPDPGLAANDWVAAFAAFRSDGATPTAGTPTGLSIAATGCTFTRTQDPATDPETALGGDMGMTCVRASVDTGPNSAAPVLTATLASTHTGSARMVRLRVAATTPTRGLVSKAELEAPFVATRGRISFAELEAPLAPTRGRISFAELEAPNAPANPTRGHVSFAELEAPFPPTPTRGQISRAELEAPFVATRGLISMAELQAPDLSAGAQATRSRLHIGVRL